MGKTIFIYKFLRKITENSGHTSKKYKKGVK